MESADVVVFSHIDIDIPTILCVFKNSKDKTQQLPQYKTISSLGKNIF
jgi:hypothetical protein